MQRLSFDASGVPYRVARLKPRIKTLDKKWTSWICRGRGLSLSLLLIGQIHRGSVFWLVIAFFLAITSVVCGFTFNSFHQRLFYFTSIRTFNKFLSLLGIMLFPVNPAPPTRVLHVDALVLSAHARVSLPVPSLSRVWLSPVAHVHLRLNTWDAVADPAWSRPLHTDGGGGERPAAAEGQLDTFNLQIISHSSALTERLARMLMTQTDARSHHIITGLTTSR